MIPATEQQLQLVARKVHRLEASVQAQIDSVKSLREEKTTANARVDRLRVELAEAEEIAARVNHAHDDAQEQLRTTALDYARTQLLQKKFQNTLLELQGFNKSVAKVANTQRGSQQFVIADDCTLNAVGRKKSFVLDAVFDDCANDDFLEATASIPQFVSDCLAGYNCTYFTFGPARGGKTELIYGSQALDLMRLPSASSMPGSAVGVPGGFSRGSYPRATSAGPAPSASTGGTTATTSATSPSVSGGGTNGVLPRFVRYLFSHMEQHDVTHYNIRCSFIEMHQDHVVDLLSDYGSSVISLGSAVGGGPGAGVSSLNEVSSVQVQTVQDVLFLFQNGLQRTGLAQRGGSSRSGSGGSAGVVPPTPLVRTPAHTAFTLLLENFNTRGHFRRSHVTFVDLCGSQNPSISTPEQLWVNKSISAVCDVISMLAATAGAASRNGGGDASAAPNNTSQSFLGGGGGGSFSAVAGGSGNNNPYGGRQGSASVAATPEIPHRHNRLVQLLRGALGGNSKAVMLVSADAAHSTDDEVMTALTYAYFFKSIKQQAVPYDIPPELQRLNLQMGGLPME